MLVHKLSLNFIPVFPNARTASVESDLGAKCASESISQQILMLYDRFMRSLFGKTIHLVWLLPVADEPDNIWEKTSKSDARKSPSMWSNSRLDCCCVCSCTFGRNKQLFNSEWCMYIILHHVSLWWYGSKVVINAETIHLSTRGHLCCKSQRVRWTNSKHL